MPRCRPLKVEASIIQRLIPRKEKVQKSSYPKKTKGKLQRSGPDRQTLVPMDRATGRRRTSEPVVREQLAFPFITR